MLIFLLILINCIHKIDMNNEFLQSGMHDFSFKR
jgi:hypothetical protein